MIIGIIDYGMGNLRSVQKALQSVGAEAEILRDPRQAEDVDKLILPGVGAFADGMEHLNRLGWIEPIRRYVDSGRPFLGICLGLQLLFEHSEEGDAAGLSILPGKVVRFSEQRGGQRLKVPHMGWNTLNWTRRDPLLADLEQGAAVYFVHAYYAAPGDPALVSAEVDYGGRFCASVWRDNLWATQFHPEKSQRVGLSILRRFADVS
ncbi:MAG: imidazole glycerol phosphate synthase subunit HisH [Phycisphaeraceae bacterium]|nr:imidazole glycerol phosphate synthase subunit HisH [Phycisphaeraceae bacterium]